MSVSNGIIPDGKVIDHVNNIKDDNRLSNIQLITQQENCKKSAKRRDYTFAAKNHQNKKVCGKQLIVKQKKFHIIIVCMLFNNILVLNAGIVKMVL